MCFTIEPMIDAGSTASTCRPQRLDDAAAGRQAFGAVEVQLVVTDDGYELFVVVKPQAATRYFVKGKIFEIYLALQLFLP